MDPTLITSPDWASVVLYFAILAAIVAGAIVFNPSRNGDAAEALEPEDDWGWR